MTDDPGTPQRLNGPEFPTPDRLRVYGDFHFLATRSAHHLRMSVANLKEALEPPIILGQYHVFRFDGIPRGAITWGLLGAEAEARYVTGHGLEFNDWRSGEHLWIIDMISPYRGLTAGMIRWIMTPGNIGRSEFRFRRISGDRETRRIVHINLDTPDNKARVMTERDFLSEL